MNRILILAMALAIYPATTFAQAETAAGAPAVEEESPWAGKASLGYLSTSGNTNTTSYNTSYEVSYSKNKWAHIFDGSANGSDESETTTAEAYQVGWKSTYDFSEHNYLFGRVSWRKDRFSGVSEQLSESLGYGRRLIETPAHLLTGELGVGHRSSDLVDNTSESGVIGTAGLKYVWTFTEASNFEQTVVVEAGADNTYVESVSAVRARLLGQFAMVFSYTVRNNSDVPIGSEKTDKFTAISLEYAF
jgi:putative salt-induced outer membrane protein